MVSFITHTLNVATVDFGTYRTTKVEGMLAISRLATFHPSVLAKDIHTAILALVYEVKNLRSTVARTAIFTLGDLLVKMKRHVEPVSVKLQLK